MIFNNYFVTMSFLIKIKFHTIYKYLYMYMY